MAFLLRKFEITRYQQNIANQGNLHDKGYRMYYVRTKITLSW